MTIAHVWRAGSYALGFDMCSGVKTWSLGAVRYSLVDARARRRRPSPAWHLDEVQEDDARRQEGGDGDVDWRECGAIRAHVASSGSTGHVGQTIGSGHSGCDANARRSAGSEYSIASRRREDERCGEGVAGVSIRGARALLGKLWRPPGKAEG